MAWYDIPKIKVSYVYDEQGQITDVLVSAKDFEKLVEKMEDFLDVQDIEESQKQKISKFYTHAEIKKIIKSKKR